MKLGCKFWRKRVFWCRKIYPKRIKVNFFGKNNKLKKKKITANMMTRKIMAIMMTRTERTRTMTAQTVILWLPELTDS